MRGAEHPPQHAEIRGPCNTKRRKGSSLLEAERGGGAAIVVRGLDTTRVLVSSGICVAIVNFIIIKRLKPVKPCKNNNGHTVYEQVYNLNNVVECR